MYNTYTWYTLTNLNKKAHVIELVLAFKKKYPKKNRYNFNFDFI